MARSIATVEIQGDFIDSFVYSGALFLIDADGVLRTYPWKELIVAALSRKNDSMQGSVFSLLTEGGDFVTQAAAESGVFESKSIYIESTFLSDFEGATIDFNCWPTDINIYSNNLYIASENGASKQGFSWDMGRIKEFQKPTVLWDEMAFRVSPNSMNRTAIAAGQSGVIVTRSNDRKDTAQVLDNACGDVEWKGATLIANTVDGPLIAEFEDIPKYSALLGSQAEYWKIVNAIKGKGPTSIEKIEISGKYALSSWTGGDRIFAIDREFHLYAASQNKIKDSENRLPDFEALDSLGSSRDRDEVKFLSSKTGAFGTVIEFSDALFEFSEHGLQKISDHPVRWRVFPRARNFANHLHVVEEHSICIKAFGTVTDSTLFGRFGFSLASIEDSP